MTGRRLPDGHSGSFGPGDYAKVDDGRAFTGGDRRPIWYAQPPAGGLANLSNHDVVEHEDGTITVSPSILVHQTPVTPEWHGFLERGVWREV